MGWTLGLRSYPDIGAHPINGYFRMSWSMKLIARPYILPKLGVHGDFLPSPICIVVKYLVIREREC
jgi:hypothetical protein